MTRYLLDTNVLSELRRPSPTYNVVHFMSAAPLASLYISEVTLAEIRFGIESVADPIRRAALARWFTDSIRPMFVGRTLPVSEDVIVRWRSLIESGRKSGRTFAQPDLFLAATALEHGMVLVTRNVADFIGLDLVLVNPWEDAD